MQQREIWSSQEVDVLIDEYIKRKVTYIRLLFTLLLLSKKSKISNNLYFTKLFESCIFLKINKTGEIGEMAENLHCVEECFPKPTFEERKTSSKENLLPNLFDKKKKILKQAVFGSHWWFVNLKFVKCSVNLKKCDTLTKIILFATDEQYVMKPLYYKVYLQIIGKHSPSAPLNSITFSNF